MNDSNDRFNLSNESLKRLTQALRKNGYTVFLIGQEFFLDDSEHAIIRYCRDKASEFLKHLPDIFCLPPSKSDKEPCFIECKATSEKHWGSPNFSIETISLEMCQFLDKNGISTFIIFENQPYEFYGNWARFIEPFRQNHFDLSKQHQGSGTPMSLVKKNTLSRITGLKP